MTQRQIILTVLKHNPEWVEGWALEKISTDYGWIGTSGGRRCRELAEEGLIERKVEKGIVWYRYPRTIQQTLFHEKAPIQAGA